MHIILKLTLGLILLGQFMAPLAATAQNLRKLAKLILPPDLKPA